MADSQKYVATNVFDINNPNVLNGYIDSSGNYVPYATNGTLYVPITAGTSYAVSGIIRASQSTVVRIATFTAIPSTQTASVNLYTLNQGDSITITAGNNENYLFVMFCGDSDYNAYGSVQAALTTNCANLHIDTYAWQHSLRKLTTATEAVENPLYSDGTAITAYTLKGNTVQNGTPTPSNPVDVNGVGERTENLAHDISVNTVTSQYASVLYFDADLKPDTTYVVHVETENEYQFYSNERLFTTSTYKTTTYGYADWVLTTQSTLDKTNPQQAYNGRWNILKNGRTQSTDVAMTNIMITEGSTIPTSYIPYGYKIPISTLQGSAVNYLGSVQTTRQIQKLELTGDETFSWSRSTSYSGGFFTAWGNVGGKPYYEFYCSHAQYVPDITDYSYGTCYSDGSLNIRIMPEGSTVTQWREYLAQQYAAGTPVTVWYVLLTATTATVNEPLMKIGDFADSISNATAIPTTEGANSITVDTTVQPSEFTATWTGWHNAYVKEKSENLFDKSLNEVYPNSTLGNANEWAYGSGSTGTVIRMACKPNTTYTLSISNSVSTTVFRISITDSDRKPISGQIGAVQCTTLVNDGSLRQATITTMSGTKYILFQPQTAAAQDAVDSLMLNEGQTALPYEPYWK